MKKIYLLFLALTLVSPACNATIEKNYDNGLLNSQHMKEFNIFERGTKLPQILIDQPKIKSYFINTVNFEKNTAFTSEKLTEIISDKIGSELTSDDLTKMTENITQFYHVNGYKSAVVTISDEELEQGTIIFSVYEGPKKQFKELPEFEP